MNWKRFGKALLFPPAVVLVISLPVSTAALVYSMLTLENTMLTTFGGEAMAPETTRLFLGLSGGTVSVFIIAMAVYMIVQANRKLRSLEGHNDGI